MEVRLGTRAKIKKVLEAISEDFELTFDKLFSAGIAKAVLMSFWTHVKARLPLMDNAGARPEDMLSDLAAASEGKAKPAKLLQQLGCVMLINSVGFRGAAVVIGRHCNSRSWERYKRELKVLPLPSANRFTALDQVGECLSQFVPLRMESLSRTKSSVS